MEKNALLADRQKLRQSIGARVAYSKSTAATAAGVGAGGGFANPMTTRTVVLNFVAGVDAPFGAKTFADFYPPALKTLSLVLNAVAWIGQTKSELQQQSRQGGVQRTREGFSPLHILAPRHVTMTLEVVPDAAQRRVAGYRIWLDLEEHANSQANLTVQERVLMETAADDVHGAGDAPPPRRTPMQAARAEELRKHFARQNASPLATGIAASIAEAAALERRVAAARKTSTRTIPDPATLLAYRWADVVSYSALLLDAVRVFFKCEGKREMPADPEPEFLDYDDFTGCAHYVNARSVVNPDRLFSKERAMAYKTVRATDDDSGDAAAGLDWSVEHCMLHSYYENAHARLLTDDEEADEPDAFRGRPSLRALFDDNKRPRYPDGGVRQYPTPRLVYPVNTCVRLAEVLVPYVALPFAMGTDLPEVALQPYGDEPLFREPPLPEVVRLLESVERLRIMEAERRPGSSKPVRAARTGRRAAAAAPGDEIELIEPLEIHNMADVIRHLHTPAHPSQRHSDEPSVVPMTPAHMISDTLEERRRHADAPPPNGNAGANLPARLKSVYEHQKNRVQVWFQQRHDDAQRQLYRELTGDARGQSAASATREWVSTHDEVGPGDLVDRLNRLSEFENILTLVNGLNEELNTINASSVASAVTTDQVDRILEQTDVIPREFRERNDFNEVRAKNQMQRLLLEQRHLSEQEAFLNGRALEAVLVADENGWRALVRQQRGETHDLYQRLMRSHVDMVLKSQNAPVSFLKARDFAVQNLMGTSKDGAHIIWSTIDGREAANYWQFCVDSYVAVEPISAQNFPYMARAHVASFNAHRFKPDRSQPATNYLVAGAPGEGKSHVLLRAAKYAVEGLAQNTTASTTAAYNVDQDFDHEIVIYEEMDSNLLFTNKNTNDTGATDKINYAKARLTSFFTVTQYFHKNEETGTRESRRAYSSQNVVFLGATNQNLDNMDGPMKRRWIVDYVFSRVAQTDGGKVSDNESFSLFTQTSQFKQVQHTHRAIHWAVMIVETAVRAGVLSDVLEDGARLQLRCILSDAAHQQHIATSNVTRQNWIVELARTLALVDACYTALYSPTCHFIYSNCADVARWSPAMFLDVVAPRLVIMKDHVMLALEMFDFLYASRDEQQLLATIVEGICHVSEPGRWRFRAVANGEHGTGIDANYLSIRGATNRKIAEAISEAHKSIAQPRPEDIVAMLGPYEKMMVESPGFEALLDEHNTVTGLRRKTSGESVARPAIFFENDPTSLNASTPKRQLNISVQFAEQRFGFNIEHDTPGDIVRKILSQREPYDARYFADDSHAGTSQQRSAGLVIARSIVRCGDDRAPFIPSIRRVLSHPVLEKSPYEHASLLPVPPQAFDYATFYMPDDVHIKYSDSLPNLRIPQHGTTQVLRLARDPARPFLRYENYARPLPTARHSVFANDEARMDLSRGFVVDDFDPDFHMAVKQMQRLGHPGFPELEALFLADCRASCGNDAAAFQRLLHEVPEIGRLERARHDPETDVTPLPFVFAPIAYRINRYVQKQYSKTQQTSDYAALNVIARIEDSVMRKLSLQMKTTTVFASYGTKLGTSMYFKHPRGDDDDADAAEAQRARKRPRRGSAVAALVDAMDVEEREFSSVDY